jgi:hypothetical protein
MTVCESVVVASVIIVGVVSSSGCGKRPTPDQGDGKPAGAPPVAATRPASAPALSEREKIERLLAYVAQSPAIFVRNGTDYSGAQAADHLRTKWNRAGSRIATAREFIDQAATSSSATGKPYQIRIESGEVIVSRQWLLEALTRIEARTTTSPATCPTTAPARP